MNDALTAIFLPYGTVAALLLIAGIFCIVATRNLIRLIIGIELCNKAVTLLLIAAGYVTGNTGLAQTLVITLLFIEVVVVVVAGGIIIALFRKHDSLDIQITQNLKG